MDQDLGVIVIRLYFLLDIIQEKFRIHTKRELQRRQGASYSGT